MDGKIHSKKKTEPRIVKEHSVISDPKKLADIRTTIMKYPKELAQYKNKPKAIGFFVGLIKKEYPDLDGGTIKSTIESIINESN